MQVLGQFSDTTRRFSVLTAFYATLVWHSSGVLNAQART